MIQMTDEQQAIVDASKGTGDNIMTKALAGTGKSTTLVLQMLAAKPEQKFDEPVILSLAFNTRITKDMQEKLKEFKENLGVPIDHIEVRGLNSCGHRTWAATVSSRLTVDKKKTGNIVRQILSSELKGQDLKDAWDAYYDICDAVGAAKIKGYVPSGKYPHAKRLTTREDFYDSLDERLSPFVQGIVDHALLESIKAAYGGLIDFDDQIYMPTLFGGTFPRFPLVVCDETQDFNEINHAMLEKLVRDRLFTAGDEWQSIYAFRGAVPGSMARLQSKFNMSTFPLTNTFRCPEEVVKVARSRVPEYKSRKPGGKYEILKSLYPRDIPDKSAIICRNNAPLFRTALLLLRAGRSVSVAGSDIGVKILRIMQKLGDDDTPRDSLISLIGDWADAKLEKNKDMASIMDMAECMRVFANQGKTLGQAIAWGESLFAQQGTLTLLTGHKAKGLEWDVVYHLDPHLIRQDDEQDLNLEYVIRTRSKSEAYEIKGENIIWQ